MKTINKELGYAMFNLVNYDLKNVNYKAETIWKTSLNELGNLSFELTKKKDS